MLNPEFPFKDTVVISEWIIYDLMSYNFSVNCSVVYQKLHFPFSIQRFHFKIPYIMRN